MARAALDLTQQALARQADVGVSMVKRLEAGEAVVPWMVQDVCAVLEAGGVQFVRDGDVAGIMLRTKKG